MSTSSDRDDDVRAYLGVGFGVVIVSTAAILIRLAQAEAHSLVVAAWRLTIATLILTPFAWVKVRLELRTLTRREWGSVFLSGLLLAIHFATWITSLAYTSVAASVVLVWTSPIFVGLVSHLFLGERLTREMVIALIVAISGAVVIGLGDFGEGTHRLLGDLLAVMGAIAGAGYFLIGRRLRARLSLLGYVYPVYGTAALVLMLVMVVSGLPRVPQRSETWLWLTLMALGPQILGHSSLNWALRYLSATYVTLATLGEPIGSALLAWWLLGERPTLWAVLGGLLILGGIVVGSHAERPVVTTDQGGEESMT
jgi:drug/metabolite transporter (DMT)-like permease